MKSKEISILILSPILGFLAFLIPELFGTSIDLKDVFTISFIEDIYKSMIFIPTLILLIIIGFVLGFISPRQWFLLGLLTIIIFPIASLYEIIISRTSHNLWPIEFALYCFFAIPAILGAYMGNRIKSRLKKS